MENKWEIKPKYLAIIAFVGSILCTVENLILTIDERADSYIFLLVAFWCLHNFSVFWKKHLDSKKCNTKN